MKQAFRASEERAWEWFAQQPYLDVAGSTEGGTPILRTFNAVVHEGALLFHCGVTGEKMGLFGRPVVAQTREPLAIIPSYFVDPVLACPATTFFRSAQAHGRLESVDDPAQKAAGLAALMARHQPEGGHAPIDIADPRYESALRTITVGRLVPEVVRGKLKLGQNRSGSAMLQVIEGLWQRGSAGDLETIRAIGEDHPARPWPTRWQPSESVRLCISPDAGDARAAAALLLDEYWWQADARRPEGQARAAAAQLGSSAWVIARHAEHGVVGSARAHGDGSRHAFLMDFVVDARFRGQGIGRALRQTLLDHPRLRQVQTLELRTRDAQGFYADAGFVRADSPYETLVLRRG